MKYKNKNFNSQEKAKEDNSFASLLTRKGNNVLRDTYILISPEDTDSGKLKAGFTAVYPGCSTSGHEHSDYEEIYFITKGKGIAQIDKEKFKIEAGDTFYVPFALFHKVNNPNNENLEYFWVLHKKN